MATLLIAEHDNKSLKDATAKAVTAAKALGGKDFYILLKHVVPNTFASVTVIATFAMAIVIISEASLSFLGLGVRPPTPSWGSILNDGYGFIRDTPWPVIGNVAWKTEWMATSANLFTARNCRRHSANSRKFLPLNAFASSIHGRPADVAGIPGPSAGSRLLCWR